MVSGGWPALSWESLDWVSRDPTESRRAQRRTAGPYRSAVPPEIAGVSDLGRFLPAEVVVDAEDAVAALARFDGEFGRLAAPFVSILLRSESSSSSEIEHLTASPRNIALAELGLGAAANSTLIVANGRAMEAAIALAGGLDEAAVLAMHQALLGQVRPDLTGRWRDQPVWIGGGYANSPHHAAFVPPDSARVPALMADLIRFARRVDLPALPQIALAHAQFETIHPFPDGNGRTGRALAHAMLHRLGITRSVVVPISAGLLGDVDAYFAALTAYREGDIAPVVAAFSRACLVGVENGRELVAAIDRFREQAEVDTSARRGSAGWRAIEVLMRQPVVNAQVLSAELGVTVQNAQLGLDRLAGDGIITESTAGRRNRLYQADAVLAALDAFAERSRRGRRGTG